MTQLVEDTLSPDGAQSITIDPRWRRTTVLVTVLSICLVFIFLGSVGYGVNSVLINPFDIPGIMMDGSNFQPIEVLALNVRFPRALMAMLIGAALAIAGALLQALYRNPLADPGLTGVTGGAVAAVLIFRIFGPELPLGWSTYIIPAIAIAGALFAASITWFFASIAGEVHSLRLILIGVLVGGFFSSLMAVAMIFSPSFELIQDLLSWFSGSLVRATWSDLGILFFGLLLVSPTVFMAIPRANLMQFGDDLSQGLGQSTTPARAIILFSACLITGIAVSTVGLVGFVGLMVPHMVRWYVGTDLRRLVPACAVAGAFLVSVLDFAARNLRSGLITELTGIPVLTQSLPVGIYLSLIGGVFFLVLVRKIGR